MKSYTRRLTETVLIVIFVFVLLGVGAVLDGKPHNGVRNVKYAESVTGQNPAGGKNTELAEVSSKNAGQAATEADSKENAESIITENGKKESKNQESGNDDAIVEKIDQILADGTRQLFENYPVDESFFLWLANRYGIGTLDDIAGKVAAGNQDPKLWYKMTGASMHVLWLEYCKDYSYQTWRLDHVTWKDAGDEEAVTIDFVGDINFDPTWHTMKYAKKKGGVSECISKELLDELQSADITMVNNEFCYTKEKKTQEGKAYSFKADPSQVDLLDLFGTDIVSLANNHTCDYGEQGLLDTMDTLNEKGIVYSGAGRNLAEASAVQYFVTGGRKIAFVSATEIERFYHFTKKAGKNTPGVLKTQQEDAVRAAIAEARANSDYVILFVHWGAEGKIKQDSDQRALAKSYADAGVDAIIGSHPHRLQGVEFVDDVPVVYSLGNFWFSTGTLYATIGQIRINTDGKLQLRLIPCEQDSQETRLLTKEEECKNFYQYVADLSEGIQINEDGVFDKWDESAAFTVPPAYRSGRQYGQHFDNADLKLRTIDVVGNLQ